MFRNQWFGSVLITGSSHEIKFVDSLSQSVDISWCVCLFSEWLSLHRIKQNNPSTCIFFKQWIVTLGSPPLHLRTDLSTQSYHRYFIKKMTKTKREEKREEIKKNNKTLLNKIISLTEMLYLFFSVSLVQKTPRGAPCEWTLAALCARLFCKQRHVYEMRERGKKSRHTYIHQLFKWTGRWGRFWAQYTFLSFICLFFLLNWLSLFLSFTSFFNRFDLNIHYLRSKKQKKQNKKI